MNDQPIESPVTRNLLANLSGTAWIALAQLILIPFYVRWMGMEAFGLVGFYLAIQAVIPIVDLGFGAAVNREVARLSIQPGGASRSSALVRSLAPAYWLVGLAAGACFLMGSSALARTWFSSSTLTPDEIVVALRWVGVLVGLQIPQSLYLNALLGAQRHVALNAARAAMAVVTGVVSLLAIGLASPLPSNLFAAQSICQLASALILARLARHALGTTEVDPGSLVAQIRSLAPFALGMAGVSISGVLLMQMDKIVLSRFLPLETFGQYALAISVGSGLYLFILPIFNTLFPRLSALREARRFEDLAALYRVGSQIMAASVFTLAITLGVWSRDLIFAWTGELQHAETAIRLVPLIAVGTALSGLVNLPFALQLAAGWTRLGLVLNLVLLVTGFPVLILLAPRLGPFAGAIVWAAVNFVYLAVSAPLTHRRFRLDLDVRWFLADLGVPIAFAAAAALALSKVLPMTETRLGAFAKLALALTVIGLASACSRAQMRHALLGFVAGIRSAARRRDATRRT